MQRRGVRKTGSRREEGGAAKRNWGGEKDAWYGVEDQGESERKKKKGR